MKRNLILTLLLIALCTVFSPLFAQENLPRLAVVEFNVNDETNKRLKNDSVTIRELVQSNIVGSNMYDVIARSEIDKLLENQKIQTSAISSSENLKKLQLQNISYIVTGTIGAMDNDYAVTISMLDVSSGKFTYSDNEFMSNSSRSVYSGISTLVSRFLSNLNSDGGTVVVQKEKNPTHSAKKNPVANPQSLDGMVYVEGGTFQMGSNNGGSDEKPVHKVTVSSFYIGKYEVTQKEYEDVMGTNPSYFKGENLPVEMVNWYDAVEYCIRRSVAEGLAPCYKINGYDVTCDWNANGYRLPTEAEWEYAAKGGNNTYISSVYSGSNNMDIVAWHAENSNDHTHPVGTKRPNELGLYDMSGNVWEWCFDDYDSFYYSRSQEKDPVNILPGRKVLRGGCFWKTSSTDEITCFNRGAGTPTNSYNIRGFRVVRNIKTNRTSQEPKAYSTKVVNSISDNMIYVKGDNFIADFYIGKYEVTQAEYQSITGGNPSRFRGGDLPVECVSWYDAVQYCNILSAAQGLVPCYKGSGTNITCDFNANGYRLPTEAEWEYAAKGGVNKNSYEYSGSNDVNSVAWYDGNSGDRTHKVGTKAANSLGIHDMSGNVWEWCWDWYDNFGSYRVYRGGSWYSYASSVRCANRNYYSPGNSGSDYGFRVVRSAK